MKQETLKHLGDGAIISAVSTGAINKLGWLSYLNENAGGIGLIITTFFGLIGLFFYYLTWKKSILADVNKIELIQHGEKLDAHIKETNNQFKCLNNGVKSILDRLDK